MAQRNPRLWENSRFREVVGTVGVIAILLVFTEMTLRTVIPLVVLLGGVIGHDIADERYDLPKGTNWLVYGTTVIVAGAYLAVLGGLWVGGFLALIGCWFAFDGATTVRCESGQTTHKYVSDLDDNQGETMLRMQTLNSIYQQLKTTEEPQTSAEIATDIDLTVSRTESALDFLIIKGRAEQVGDQYRAEPSQWGRLAPVVRFLRWLPQRVLRPFRQVAANS